MVALIDKKINFLYFPFLGMSAYSTNTAIGYGSLRTTLEIDRLFVQQIYIRTANNTPISTGYVLQSDGNGGTFLAPLRFKQIILL